MAGKDQGITIEVPEISKQTLVFAILGTTPLICNRMSEKAKRELLMPRGRLNATAKAISMKHDPMAEFRASPYTFPQDDAPTLLAVMSSSFKAAMCTAALDLPGTKKAQIGRLAYVQGDYTPVYGTPELFMSVTRSADINHTPDIRTRAILPEWACKVEITFVTPVLNETSISRLLVAAGVTAGVGDYRPEKGKGNYGQFRIVDQESTAFKAILQQGREAQKAAMLRPECYDHESAELLKWWTGEFESRDFKKRIEKVA